MKKEQATMDLTAVDLFSGGGGASIGLHQLDQVTICGAAEIHETRREYYNRNLPLEAADIDLSDEDAFAQFSEFYGVSAEDIDLVIGCPPCQKFSSLQDTTPEKEEGPKNRLINAYLDFILAASPKVVIFENVPGLLNRGNEEYVEDLLHYLQKAGYGTDIGLLNMADFGVPQARKRTIGVGIHGVKRADVSLPEPTHYPPDEAEELDEPRWRTVRMAIGDLPPLEAGERRDDLPFNGHRARNHREKTVDFMRKIPKDGGSRTDLPEEEQLACHKRLSENGGAGNVYGRMSWDEPGPTLTGRCITPSSGRFVHPEQDRGISPREAARIMTFPDSYELPEQNREAEQLIGNAVPPMFIEKVVVEFLESHAEFIESRTVIAAD